MTTGASDRRCATLAPGVCAVAAAVLALMLLAAGCDETTAPRPAATYLPQTSAGATLTNLRHAYNAHDLDALAHYPALFDSTVYRRYFSGTHPPGHFAESWGYADEARGFDAFVHDPTLVSYRMVWADSASATGVPSDSLADPPGTLRYTFTQVTVDIDHASSGVTLTGWYAIDVAPADTIAGVVYWRIVRWRDATFQ